MALSFVLAPFLYYTLTADTFSETSPAIVAIGYADTVLTAMPPPTRENIRADLDSCRNLQNEHVAQYQALAERFSRIPSVVRESHSLSTTHTRTSVYAFESSPQSVHGIVLKAVADMLRSA
ncbi:hypothetical protein BAUCODRAFT_217282 [Baudoinia panamericana UAMH 10762]|uniref:Uncharacterized protein n=1 Tax=Baudoinia panamericana (strain UAMH 10762) TaxID=717646 RepID=M2N4R2_BAUPA|nr:uncharacterized protein BAUCODRAFT_217282 [Baudoinia panamericana UAMH 10762]EMC93989.1 hypothetical protein BAUCODRAFT_217282 [Baudoinia panamericana UAMH 10762]